LPQVASCNRGRWLQQEKDRSWTIGIAKNGNEIIRFTDEQVLNEYNKVLNELEKLFISPNLFLEYFNFVLFTQKHSLSD
jgi:hypothetical protein